MNAVRSRWTEWHRIAHWLAVALLLGNVAASSDANAAQSMARASAVTVSAAGAATLIEFDGPIGPALSRYVVRSLLEADTQGSSVIILQMDTPGGLDTSMRDIIKAILASPVPVVSYVAPSGARAA